MREELFLLVFLVFVVKVEFKMLAAGGAIHFAFVNDGTGNVNGLAAGGAGYLVEGLAGDVIVVGVIRILFVVLVVFVLAVFVLVVVFVLVQVGFQILQLLAQIVDLVEGISDGTEQESSLPAGLSGRSGRG